MPWHMCGWQRKILWSQLLLSPLRGFQGSNSGHQAFMASTKMSHLSGPFICVSVTHFHHLLQMDTAPTVKPLDSFPCRFFLFYFQTVTASCFRSEPILEFHSPKHSLFKKIKTIGAQESSRAL